MTSWAGNLIKVARADTGLSQRELARRASTSQATISAYESGRKSPSLETLARIIHAAGLDLRIHVEPAVDHDEWVRSYEASLPDKVRKRHRTRELTAINRARKERGLSPVTDLDLVRHALWPMGSPV